MNRWDEGSVKINLIYLLVQQRCCVMWVETLLLCLDLSAECSISGGCFLYFLLY